MSEDFETKGLAEPFKGITTDGKVVPGLFPIQSTGVSTEPVRNAAEAFLASLSNVQRSRTLFPVDDSEWRKWMNQHFYVRQGVSFAEMNDKQRDAAFGLLDASLSARGMKLTRDIMRLNETLAEMTGDFDFLGEWLYYITIIGRPSATEPWGWQLDGHHAIINYLTMLDALSDAERKRAVLNFSKTGNNNLTEAFKDNVVLNYAGVRAADLNSARKAQLTELANLYTANMDDGHARVKMDEIKRHIDNTWFAWIGGSDSNSVYYYRIHSPVILIEFDHQRPANLARFSPDPNRPTRQHIHVVVRTPNGNDYGKDLLRQH